MKTENTPNELTAEEEKKLIAGRILDEFRKHSVLIDSWNVIAANKIHTEWKEHFTQPYIIKLQQANEDYSDLQNRNIELVEQLKSKDEMLEKMAELFMNWKKVIPFDFNHEIQIVDKLLNQYKQGK